MGELIEGRFLGNSRDIKKESAERATTLAGKQTEMRLFLNDLKKTDAKAAYRAEHVALRRSIIEQTTDDKALEEKFLSGNALAWKSDPQWWYALEEVLDVRHRFLNERFST